MSSTEHPGLEKSTMLLTEFWNGTTPIYEHEALDTASWIKIMDRCQFAITTIGFITNIVTMVTLLTNGKRFYRPTRIVFVQQSVADALVCLIASLVIFQPFMWLTGYYYVDIILCHVWHGQALFWGCVTLSTYNLVLISYERYLSVCKPFKYTRLTRMSGKKIGINFFVLVVLSLFITHGTYIQTRLEAGQCVNKFAWDGQAIQSYFVFFVIFTYITTYFLPLIIMATFYILIVRTLHKLRNDVSLDKSYLLDRVSADMTKTGVLVTIIFAISIGYDLHYYLLGHIGILTYELNTPIQKVGIFLSNLNSMANPLVYGLLVPAYRQSLTKTLLCKKQEDISYNRYAVSSQQSQYSHMCTVTEDL